MLANDLLPLIQARLNVKPQDIEALCQRWQVAELALFGSVLRDDFDSTSDIDVLVSFDEVQGIRWNLFDLIRMQQELQTLFQREVDLVEKAGLKNPYRRAEILATYQIIYANR